MKKDKAQQFNIPEKILTVLQQLQEANFEAFLVGGSVRDLIMGKEPKDWDITTSAKPEEILKVFPDGKYENDFGTVILPEKYITSPQSTVHSTQTDKLQILSEDVKISQEEKEEIINIAKKYLQKIECPAHGVKHTKDVVINALKIAEEYPAVNTELLEVLCWFHDSGRAIGEASEHVNNSQKIVNKELVKYFDKKKIQEIIQAVQHSSKEKSIFLEQQLLKEADIVDGLKVERINSFSTEEEKSRHLKWLKEEFKNSKIYKTVITGKGKELLKQAAIKFNQENFSVDIEIPNWNNVGNVEITTYRIESTYSDRRRPDEVQFAKTLEEDLGRRDFTCNAIALQVNFKFKILNFNSILNNEILNDKNKSWEEYGWKIVNLFNGVQDIKNKAIRAVGDANERFNEDALRMMRAVRFAAQLSEGEELEFLKDRKGEGTQNQKTEYQALTHKKEARWWIGENTFAAIKKNAHLLKHISPERISDEFQKIILSNRPAWGVELLVETGLMEFIIPEILDTIGVKQNRHHYYGPFNTVYKHLLAALKTCPSEKLEVRLAAFFHDIGKPESKRGHGYKSTFYGHEYISARKVKVIMERLKFPRKVIDKTVLLVKNHMFYYNTDEVGEKGVRKVVRKVGLENINDLIDVRIGDRLGSGVAKAVPYKLRHFKYMVEKVSQDPISVKDLKINGDILLADYNFTPGPQMGAILEILLAEVLDDPKKNTIEHLADRALELQKEDLQQLRKIAKDKIKEEKQKEEQQTKGKYWVK